MREFVIDTSGVVFATAMAIRGLLEGDPFLATTGLVLLAVFVSVEVVVIRARKRPPGERARRLAHGWLARFDTPRARRLLVISFAVATLTSAIRCIAAAIGSDWGGCLFYSVLAASTAVGAIVAWLERIDGEPGERAVALTIDVR